MNDGRRLAIHGGRPTASEPWPRWPSHELSTTAALIEVVESQRWAISGPADGRVSFGERFEAAFAAYHGTGYCVAVASGSAAIRVALQALGVGHGDAVLVPALTWVACASAVLAVGAVPVFVDVAPDTLCMSVEAATAAIAADVKAALLVHAFCTIADIDRFVSLCNRFEIPLIEDCSQAHGALHRGHRVGTFGAIGVFSMQQTKVLTSGEGGAAITSSPDLADRMEQLRTDGRRHRANAGMGEESLLEVGTVLGHNACITEFQAAILLERLQYLDAANARREANARFLAGQLARDAIALPLQQFRAGNGAAIYKFCVRLDLNAFANRDVDQIADALTAELGLRCAPVYDPISRSRLYQPFKARNVGWTPDLRRRASEISAHPVADRARRECVTIPHQAFLADEEQVSRIAVAITKVAERAEDLPKPAGQVN